MGNATRSPLKGASSRLVLLWPGQEISIASIRKHRGSSSNVGAPFEIVRGDAAHERELMMGVRINASGLHIAAADIDDLRADGSVGGGAGRSRKLPCVPNKRRFRFAGSTAGSSG
jgi:hypothetical protein